MLLLFPRLAATAARSRRRSSRSLPLVPPVRPAAAIGSAMSVHQWMQRHVNDPYVKASRKQELRSRAAFKLKVMGCGCNVCGRGGIGRRAHSEINDKNYQEATLCLCKSIYHAIRRARPTPFEGATVKNGLPHSPRSCSAHTNPSHTIHRRCRRNTESYDEATGTCLRLNA